MNRIVSHCLSFYVQCRFCRVSEPRISMGPGCFRGDHRDRGPNHSVFVGPEDTSSVQVRRPPLIPRDGGVGSEMVSARHSRAPRRPEGRTLCLSEDSNPGLYSTGCRSPTRWNLHSTSPPWARSIENKPSKGIEPHGERMGMTNGGNDATTGFRRARDHRPQDVMVLVEA